jgi:hypothetical protein
VALSVVVLAAAGLLVGSFLRLTAIDPGFTSRHVATFRADPSVNTLRLSTDAALRVLDELARAPGVSAAAISETVPFAGMNLGREVRVPGGTAGLMTRSHIVSPGYFGAMGIEIRAGRDFQPTDTPDGQPVVIVSERVARALWPGRSAVGERLNVLLRSGVPAAVVGVVDDVRTALDRDPVPGVYLLLTQAVADGYQPYHAFVVRTDGAPVPIVQRLESRITEITGNAVTNLTALDTSVSRSVHVPRFRAFLFGLMGLLVVVLTAVGVFSVTAHVVAQRDGHPDGDRRAGAPGAAPDAPADDAADSPRHRSRRRWRARDDDAGRAVPLRDLADRSIYVRRRRLRRRHDRHGRRDRARPPNAANQPSRCSASGLTRCSTLFAKREARA